MPTFWRRRPISSERGGEVVTTVGYIVAPRPSTHDNASARGFSGINDWSTTPAFVLPKPVLEYP